MNYLRTLLLATLIFVIACDGDKSTSLNTASRRAAVEADFSSPKALFVDHISAYSGGVISIADAIRLKFAKAVSDSIRSVVTQEVFSFSPAIEGSLSWEDNRTVLFQPSGKLKGDQIYEATANLEDIIPGIPKDKEEFRFVFQTLKQNYEVSIDGLSIYNLSDLTDLKIEGQLQTADYADLANVKKILSASQDNKDLAITIEDTGKDNIFNFIVEHVERSDNKSEVTLKSTGTPLGVDRSESDEIDIPALDDYKVVSSKVYKGEDQHISVIFSDPLDTKQNLTGLVTLSGMSARPRLVVDMNELKVYPVGRIPSSITLTINEAIRNAAGYRLKENFTTTLRIRQVKPEVKLLSKDNKAILPSSKGLVLPFEAVGLSAVDVTIIRIFGDNMLQYLQVNQLGGTSQLRRVGKPILRKTVPLNTSGVTNLNDWNTFSLDLEELIKTENGAFYQVKIGFRKRHSLYFCESSDQIQEMDEDLESWGVEDESSYWDSWEYYYDPNYNWEERDNPCSSSYYGSRRSVNRMIFASDLGIIAKRRDGGDMKVFVTSLLDTKPLSGVQVEVYDYQQQFIGGGKTDGDGKLDIPAPDDKPFALIARKDDQIGFLKLDDGSSLSLSNFDVSGTQITNGLKGFIYGERGVWRPADTVHLGFILEDNIAELPEQHPVIMELYNPNGQLTHRKISSEAVGNMYRFDFITDVNAPTGNWQAKAKVGGANFFKRVKIETIKPNRLKVNLEFDKDKFGANDQYVSADVNVRWLTGASVSNLDFEYEMKLSPVKTTFKSYPNFSFDDNSKRFYSERKMAYKGKLDNNGYARMNIDLGDLKNAPGAVKAMFYGKVYEEGGDFSISNTNIPYYPYSSFVGIKVPEGDKRGIILTDEDHEVRIATVDVDGNPVSRSNVKVELFKLNWRWWWDKSYDDISNYVGRSYRDPILTKRISTSNGEGAWKLRIDYPSWGRYFVRVTDPVSEHSAGAVVYIDWPGWAGKGKRGDLDGAAMLDFGVEKESYKVGEKVALSIPSTAGNRLLVSLESGSEVLQTFWVESEKDNTVISFEATEDMSPNVYAHLTMIQPHAQTANDLPIRLYGVQSIEVVDPQTVLKPNINMPKELKPEQDYTISISEENGKAMSYTVAIVDEGLLDITNYKTPDPWSSFYAREALGIKTWDVFDDVMGAFTAQMDRLLAIGGDGELEIKDQKEANRFKPVVRFLGPFELEAGNTNKHKIKMPQYIGSVKTMVIAANNGAYGAADKTTPVKQPLMTLATLPRVAGPGETMKLPVTVFTMDDAIKNVQVSVEATGTLQLASSKSKNVTFSKSGDKVIYFDLKVKEYLGYGSVKVTAKSGQMVAEYDIEMNVIPRNPLATMVDDKVVNSNETWQINYKPVGISSENTGYIELSTLPPLNIEQRLGFLIRYPHGCVEQTTSSVFPQLFLADLVKLDSKAEARVQNNVEAGIKKLKKFQLSNGGFAYWPGYDYANNWGTNYAGHFLLEAKKAGYAVPENMVSSWINYQKSKAESWGTMSSDDDNDLIQSYRLYTLALADNASLGAMNRMKEKTSLRIEAKWRLALAYAHAGYENQALELIDGLSATIADENSKYYRYSYGSRTRDQAMILETLLSLDKKEDAFTLLMDIAEQMSETNRWMSTQTTAYCFIAIAKYADEFELGTGTNVSIDIAGETKSVTGNEFVSQVQLADSDKESAISITNNAEAPVFARLIRTGIPIEGGEEETRRNINMTVQYQDLNGKFIGVDQLEQGTNFKAIITIANPGLKGNYTDLALTQIFPSGWEIINTRLDGSVDKLNVDYMDIRDDRTMHYFDLSPYKNKTITVLLNAAYQGKYYLPSVSVEAMYDNSIFANKTGKWVSVVPEE